MTQNDNFYSIFMLIVNYATFIIMQCYDLKLREVCFSNNERNNKVLINEKMFKDMLFR